ncbi:polyprenyl synthetase family protein [Rosistilla oblonga]|uniref:polyprenyl synthetase family protein n=1 Tax=Rosistilla oblonga TaxID=2527990 RepID=UPI003A96E92A
MSTVTPPATVASDAENVTPKEGRRKRRRSTGHLKIVPETPELRQRLRDRCREVAAKFDKSTPMTKDEMETVSRGLLADMDMPEGYLGWIMVVLSSEYWRDQVAGVPHSRRLFLLPHCLKHAEGCPADYDEFGMNCKTCGACSIADFRTRAEELGHRVLVAEGSPIVMKIIVSGYVDAVVGVACLNVLEKAIDKILLAGIPCMAVPLLSSDCRNTSVDEDWVREMVMLEHREPQQKTRSYVHLLRGAADIFEPEQLQNLVPKLRGELSLREIKEKLHDGSDALVGIDPIAATEALGLDFVSRGGKYARPFITLAAYDALTGDKGTESGGADVVAKIPDGVKRAALCIETFHKASLVHDDIEDDDTFRYGEQSVHKSHGIPTAINVGDYLIGLGYRLVAGETKTLGPAAVADVLHCLSNAHTRLSEGQGAELVWRDNRDKRLKPIDALKVYALKTAPAFEAALYSGVRLACEAEAYEEPIRGFSRNLGVAFQILNDLKDWQGDADNKLEAGGDVLGGRPTLLWALALASLDADDQAKLLSMASADCGLSDTQRIATVRTLYNKAKVFDQASRLVDKHQQRAEEIADAIEPEPLRRLLYHLVDTVLERPSESAVPLVSISSSLPITAPTKA